MKKKALATILVLVLSVGTTTCVPAKTLTKVKTIGKYTYKAKLTTSENPLRKKPIINSQAYHKKGITTTIGVSESVSTSVTADLRVAAGFDYIATMEVSMGLSVSVSYTVSTNVEYTLKNQKSGKYRIEVWYPGKVEELKLYVKNKGQDDSKYRGPAIKKSKYTPIKNGAYKKLIRYAD